MLNYFAFEYLTPDGESASGHCLAETIDDAEKLAVEFCKALETAPANLQFLCPADLKSLRDNGLWNLNDLTYGECLSLLESTKVSNEKLLADVQKSVSCQQRILNNYLSIQDCLSRGIINDHDDSPDIPVSQFSRSRRGMPANSKNDVLNSALSEIFNW